MRLSRSKIPLTVLNLFIFCLIFLSSSCTQKNYDVINYEVENNGTIEIAEGITIEKETKGYTLWKPLDTIKGALVFFRANRDTVSYSKLHQIALNKKLAVLYISSGNRLDFYFDRTTLESVQSYIVKACAENHIPINNLFYCGMSLEGTRALRLGIFQNTNSLNQPIKPKAIAICDAPLDMIRFYKECKKASDIKFHQAAANEGYWVSEHLQANLGGLPDSNNSYLAYSPYTYLQDTESNIRHLLQTPVRAYTEPDISWWIDNRRKDYYGMNSVDLAAMINVLIRLGNNNCELISTSNKGTLPDGSRHPHSWSIVDERDLVNWFLSLK